MAKDFISDAEMMDHFSSGKASPYKEPAQFISDDDWNKDNRTVGDRANALLQGAENGLTFRQVPAIQAKIHGLIPDPTKDLDADLESKGFKISQPSWKDLGTEDKYRDLRNDVAAKDPTAFHFGEASGGLLGAYFPATRGLRAVKAVAGSPMGQGITGAALGNYLYEKLKGEVKDLVGN